MKNRIVLILLILQTLNAAALFAQETPPPLPPEAEKTTGEISQGIDWDQWPESIRPGDIFPGGAINMGNISIEGYSSTAFGFSFFVDYYSPWKSSVHNMHHPQRKAPKERCFF